jgi:hypothetical protein
MCLLTMNSATLHCTERTEGRGALTVAGGLNREAMGSYSLTLQAKDAGTPTPNAGTHAVTVTIDDVNDEPPVFSVRCALFDRNLHSRMPLDPMHVRLKLLHACDQWHSSRESTSLTS